MYSYENRLRAVQLYIKQDQPGRITPCAIGALGSTSDRGVDIGRCKQKEKRFR